MVTHVRCCWRVAVWLVTVTAVVASGADGGQAEMPAPSNRKTAAPAQGPGKHATAPGKARAAARAKAKPQAKKQSPRQPAASESWTARFAGLAHFGAIGSPLFPLALVGQRALRLFALTDEAAPPPKLVCAQFSRQFVEQFFQHAIEADEVVDDAILGTKLGGQSHLSGVIGITLEPSNRELRLDLNFVGVCQSQIEGVNKVVVLENTANTQFQAQKQFVWNSHGLTYSPAVAVAETHSTTNQIGTNLPGVLGRVATQIAADRIGEARAQVDAIAAQHAAERIEQTLDARVEFSLACLGSISQQLPAASFIQRTTRFKLSSTRDLVQILILRRNARNSPALVAMAPLPKDCDVSLQVHRKMLQEIFRDPAALLVGAAVVKQILATENPSTNDTLVAPAVGARRPHWQFSGSVDGQWLVVQHFQPTKSPALQPNRRSPRQKVR